MNTIITFEPLSKPLTMRVESAVPGWVEGAGVARPLDPMRNVQRDIVYIVDADVAFCVATETMLLQAGCDVEHFADCASFLAYYRPGRSGCLFVDALLLGLHGIDLIGSLKENGNNLPTIVTSNNASSSMVVQAMRAGAFDFIEKPLLQDNFISSLHLALIEQKRMTRLLAGQKVAIARVATLTSRQHQIMDLVIAGHPSKNIAADLGISQRTVENHRAAIGRKTGSRSLSALIHTAICANCAVVN